MYDEIKYFITKLSFSLSQLSNKNLVHFPTWKTLPIPSLYLTLLNM